MRAYEFEQDTPLTSPLSKNDFSTLALNSDLLDNLNVLGFATMTAIQAQSLPDILDGKDVIAQGKTGSGKTAAFGLGLLQKLDVKRFRIQALIVCPTRELADQVAKAIRQLARCIHNIKVLSLCGGMPLGPQIGSLEHGAHIIVGTPGRLGDHIRKGTLNLNEVNTLVLDEADRMLEMGFQETLDAIIEQIPSSRQTLLFSATFPATIESIAKRYMRNPSLIKVESIHQSANIEQYFYKVQDDKDRYPTLRLLLLQHSPRSAVVFCNTKKEAQALADNLNNQGFDAAALHGDLEQRDRDQTLVRFSNRSIAVLVATDVAARGLDIDDLDAVINYHLARDPEVHVHRIGRTGRAGAKGVACSIYRDKEQYKVSALGDYLELMIKPEPMPSKHILKQVPKKAVMATLQIEGGKKQKVRAGDIVGALTAGDGVVSAQIGKINVFDNSAYVAVEREVAKAALVKISTGKLKGRNFRARLI